MLYFLMVQIKMRRNEWKNGVSVKLARRRIQFRLAAPFSRKNKDYNEDGRHSVIVEMKKDWFKTMGIRKSTSSRL